MIESLIIKLLISVLGLALGIWRIQSARYWDNGGQILLGWTILVMAASAFLFTILDIWAVIS